MKKIWILLIIAALSISLSGCGKKEVKENNKPNEETIYNEDGTIKDIDDIVENETDVKQGDLEFSKVKITSVGATNIVSTVVTNKGNKALTFKLTLFMKNKDGRTLGKVDKTIENLAASMSETVEISIMGDYTTVTEFEVISEILE